MPVPGAERRLAEITTPSQETDDEPSQYQRHPTMSQEKESTDGRTQALNSTLRRNFEVSRCLSSDAVPAASDSGELRFRPGI